MTATERLRQLLDEHGVEWWEPSPFTTDWEGTGILSDCGFRAIGSAPPADKYLVLDCDRMLTPEQAVDATLGRGTCKWEPADFITEGEWWKTSCGESFTWEPDGTPRYCPNCGRRVES